MGKQITDKRVIEQIYSDGLKHTSYGAYERGIHGFKVFKVPLNAEFTCPNWDGRLSDSGCVFCPSCARQFTYESFREVIDKGFEEQIAHQIKHYKEMGAGEKALVYIAFGTNTYAPPDVLRDIFEQSIAHKDVIGFTVGTRPDCLPDEVLDLLAEYQKRGYDVWIEAGQQTIHQHTLRDTNRQHGFAELIRVVDEAHKRNIKVLSFVILGLPGETRDEMIETARVLSAIGIDAVKIYPLVVMKNTKLANMYKRGEYRPLGKDEYASLVADFLENLSRDVVVQRMSKDCGLEVKLAPSWNTYRLIVGPLVEKELNRRGTKQGDKFKLTLSVDELKPLTETRKEEFYDDLRAQRSKCKPT